MAQIVSVRDEQLDKIKKAMERKLPFLSSVMATVNLKWSKKTSTACEDDLTEYYNPDFMNALPFDQQVAVMAHETLHIALNHIWRSKNRDSALWNIATDAVINSILKENGLYMPQGAIDMPEALHKSSEEVYDMLVKDKKQRQGDKKQRQGAKGGSGNNNQQNKQQNKQQQGESDQSSAGNKEDQKGQQSGGNQQDQKSQNQPQENNQAQSSSGSQANYKGQEDPNGNSASGTGNFGDYKEPDNHDIWADALKRMEKRNKNKNKDDNNQKQGEEKDKDKDEQNKDKNNKNKGKGDKNKDKKDKGKDNFSQGDDQRKGEGDLNPDEDEQDQEDGQSQGERDDDFEDQLNKQKEEDYRQDSQDEYKKEGEEKVQHEDNNDYNQIERDFTKLNDQLKRELADQIRKDINQRSKDWGTKSGNQTGYMGSVGEGKAIVSWKKILKKELEKEERRWGYRRANSPHSKCSKV